MSMVCYTNHKASGGWRPGPAARHARQDKSCGNSVAATVHGAYWCPFRLSMTSKPQAWFRLKPSRYQRSNGDCALRLAISVASKERSPWRTPIGLVDGRRYRNPVEPPHMFKPMGSRRDLSRSRGLTRSTVQRRHDADLFAARGDARPPGSGP